MTEEWERYNAPLVYCGFGGRCGIISSWKRGSLYVCGDHKMLVDAVEARGGKVIMADPSRTAGHN